MMQNQVAATSE